MLNVLVYGMVFCGAGLMIYNIYGFIRFARYVKNLKAFQKKSSILSIPIILLVMFLLGYLAVGIFGNPDLIVSAILFFGSIFVFIMYLLLNGITVRIIESERLEAKLMATEESNRTKSNFLSSISHEMRTPMNVILGLDGIALRNPNLQPETRRQLEKIGLSGKHLLALINNILDMNRIDTGDMELHNAEFSMEDALDQVNAIAQTVCEEKALSYQADLPEEIFGSYIGDVVLFKQVLLSILDNGAKYTDAPGKVTMSAELVSEEDSLRTLRFRISDTGIGIDKDFLPKVFGVFTQEDNSTTNRFGGSGLSLAITKRTVDLMGGTITVESEKNVGSTFTVTIPLKCVDIVSASSDTEQAAVSLEGRRILIVEDLTENAEIVQDLLELEGAITEHAENGKIALDMFSASAPRYYDAILMDLRMPVMDGLEATRMIRALDRADAKTIPIIALTANAFDSDVQNTLASGMNAHLAKPTDSDILYGTLKRFIATALNTERGEKG